MQLYPAIAHAERTSQSPPSVNFLHFLSAPTSALKSLTTRLRSSLIIHKRNHASFRSTPPQHTQKAQIMEERHRRESEGRSTSQTDLALWAKTKFCLGAPPSQPAMTRILSALSTLGLEKIGMSKRNRRGKISEKLKAFSITNWIPRWAMCWYGGDTGCGACANAFETLEECFYETEENYRIFQ